jgi:hypothetical protein
MSRVTRRGDRRKLIQRRKKGNRALRGAGRRSGQRRKPQAD